VPMYKCRRCDFTTPVLGHLNRHAGDAHKRTYKRNKSSRSAPSRARDREREFLGDIAAAFDVELEREELDAGAYDRVIAYITQRYGSAPADAA